MNPIDQNHSSKRTALRIIGPIILLAGLLFMLIGFVDFVRAMTGWGHPDLFWCFFIGMPLLFFGIVLSTYGFMGSVARYSAGEMAPVAKDTCNYMADGTKDGIRDVAEAIGGGLSAGLENVAMPSTRIRCHKCNHPADEDSKFCPSCGTPLLKTKPCPKCSELNDADARFCDNCGTQLA